MKNINIKLHEYQKAILAKLTSSPLLRFNQLRIDNLESEHMNYHLKKLINWGLVTKSGTGYSLTHEGKDYSNLMDDDIEFIEKQPKTSVLLHVVRRNKRGQVESLLSRRLRQPYWGKIGRLTGKVQFGETLEGAARRELFEETGLEAHTVVLENIYHKLRYDTEGKYVQDNIFYRFFIKDTYGSFIDKTKHQENIWLTAKEAEDTDKYDLFDDLYIDQRFEPLSLGFTEENKLAVGY